LLGAAAFLSFACASLCIGQAANGVHGHVFRSNPIGLTYTFPEKFASKVESEMPQDPSGREHVILALWDTPQRSGIPRMAFLYDTKVRPAGSSREAMASRYLEALRQQALQWQGGKVSEPRKISPAGHDIWRMDYWHPAGSAPPFNSGIVIPLKDRRILAIQINAPSQSELDSEVDSLRDLHFDKP
jgi:hypothetical protein